MKKRIFTILKVVGFILLICVIVTMFIGSCKKTYALTSYPNYNYKYVGIINNKTQVDSNYYQCSFAMTNYYNGDEWVEGNNGDLTGLEVFIQIVLDTSDGLGISNANVTNGNLYMVKGSVASGDRYNIYSITTITIYNRVLTNDIYTNGYDIGLSSTTSDAYSQGYSSGYTSGYNSGSSELNSQKNYYEGVIDSQNQDIQYYQNIINSGSSPWGSFTSLLGTIFLFPIRFFKEGFDVDLFGVNLGGFIVGVGILAISFLILGVIFGGKVGKKS